MGGGNDEIRTYAFCVNTHIIYRFSSSHNFISTLFKQLKIILDQSILYLSHTIFVINSMSMNMRWQKIVSFSPLSKIKTPGLFVSLLLLLFFVKPSYMSFFV